MENSKIYHGGGMCRNGGFPASSAAPTTNKQRIWIGANDFTGVNTLSPSGPSTRAFPLTINTRVWAFSASALQLMFIWIPLPLKNWNYDLTAPTGLDFRFHWYTEFTAATIISWRAEINFVRHGETMNFVPPVLEDMNKAAGTQYLLNVNERLDMPINNPSGSSTVADGAFYLKMGRDGAAGQDTFPQEAYIIGASIDFPIS